MVAKYILLFFVASVVVQALNYLMLLDFLISDVAEMNRIKRILASNNFANSKAEIITKIQSQLQTLIIVSLDSPDLYWLLKNWKAAKKIIPISTDGKYLVTLTSNSTSQDYNHFLRTFPTPPVAGFQVLERTKIKSTPTSLILVNDFENLSKIALIPCVEQIIPDWEYTLCASSAAIQPIDYLKWNLAHVWTNTESRENNKYFKFNYSGKGVSVYLADSGVYAEHEDFRSKMDKITNKNYLAPSGLSDSTGHGTHLAGIILGDTVGIARDVHLTSLVLADHRSKIRLSNLIRAIQEILHGRTAQSNTAVMLIPIVPEELGALSSIFKAMKEKNLIAVISAGNDGQNICHRLSSISDHSIIVGSINSKGERASHSNYGKCVEFYAPGESIFSTSFQNSTDTKTLFAYKTGTSTAAAHVAAIVATYLEQQPSLGLNEIKECIPSFWLLVLRISSSRASLQKEKAFDFFTPTTEIQVTPCSNGHCSKLEISKTIPLEPLQRLILEFAASSEGTFQCWLYGTDKPWKAEVEEASFFLEIYRRNSDGKEELLKTSANLVYPQYAAIGLQKGVTYSVKLAENKAFSTSAPVKLHFWHQQPKPCKRIETCGGHECNDVGDCSGTTILPKEDLRKPPNMPHLAIPKHILNAIVILILVVILLILIGSIVVKFYRKPKNQVKRALKGSY